MQRLRKSRGGYFLQDPQKLTLTLCLDTAPISVKSNAINHGFLQPGKSHWCHLTGCYNRGCFLFSKALPIEDSYFPLIDSRSILVLQKSPLQMEHEFALFLGLGSTKSLSSAAQWLKEQIVCDSLRIPRRNTLLDRL